MAVSPYEYHRYGKMCGIPLRNNMVKWRVERCDGRIGFFYSKEQAIKFMYEIERETKMAELKCSDGTVIKISAETEKELRKAFGPKQETYAVGDVIYREKEDGTGCHYFRLVNRQDYPHQVGLVSLASRSMWNAANGYLKVNDKNHITHDELCQMTVFSKGLRKARKLVISEE